MSDVRQRTTDEAPIIAQACSRKNQWGRSLTTAIIVLLGLEIVAALRLFGAQVIAEYERFGEGDPLHTPAPLQAVPGAQTQDGLPRIA